MVVAQTPCWAAANLTYPKNLWMGAENLRKLVGEQGMKKVMKPIIHCRGVAKAGQ